jgi:hypothetical protein
MVLVEASCDECIADGRASQADFRVFYREYFKHVVRDSMGHDKTLCPLHLSLYRAEREAQKFLHPKVNPHSGGPY